MRCSYSLEIENIPVIVAADVEHWPDGNTPWKFEWVSPAPMLWEYLKVLDKDKHNKIIDIVTKAMQEVWLDAQEKTLR